MNYSNIAHRRISIISNHLTESHTVEQVPCVSTTEAMIVGGAVAMTAGVVVYNMNMTDRKIIQKKTWDDERDHAGILIAEALKIHGVRFMFTLCGGHISPILTGANQKGIKVIDVRHEANAAFAADAVSRLSGIPGVVAVTAGPGLTNTITAVKNAQVAQSPMIILGGATSDLLKGRQSLQDIDQFALFKPHVKWMAHVKRVIDVVPAIEQAFYESRSGTPGPVFLEFPADVLYSKGWVKGFLGKLMPPQKSTIDRVVEWYLNSHASSIFTGLESPIHFHEPLKPLIPHHANKHINKLLNKLRTCKAPMLLLGSQTMLQPELIENLIQAINYLRIPVWLQGMCRGLLWTKNSNLYIRSNRASAFNKTDCLIVCGVPFDFRTQYGLSVPFNTFIASINRHKTDLKLNSDLKFWTSPSIKVHGDPCEFIIALAQHAKLQNLDTKQWDPWVFKLRSSDEKKDEANLKLSKAKTSFINPLRLCFEVDNFIGDNSILIGDGGDFVGTASYIIRPRGPLTWLDPGVFGTLGVGAGFAMAAKLLNPNSEIWLIWGDGACGFSIVELDTFRRHNIPVIAVIGNDACWTQIHRDQIQSLKDDTGCKLEYTNYHQLAQSLGAEGFLIDSDDQIAPVLAKTKELYAQGKSVVINAKIGKTEFRDGSLSA